MTITRSGHTSASTSDSAADTAVLYLSGAPRLSTHATTESLGPRSHILGVINALKASGLAVEPFIVGDSTPDSLHGEGSEARMASSGLRLALTDAARIWYRIRSRTRLRRSLKGRPAAPFAYERYALLQDLGSVAQKRGSFWVLEVNALLAIEATSERRATSSRKLATSFERRTLRSADAIVAVTNNLARAIAHTYGIPLDRIIVVENGVDVSVHEPSRAQPAVVPTIGFLGSLYSWQRVDDLLVALQDEQLSAWRLRVAGTGPEFDALRRRAVELGVDNRVEFLGRVHPDDVPEFLRSVDICYAGHGSANGVYFSPLKLWEYMAAGRPVVASTHETTATLQAEGFAVVCFGDDDDALRNALRDALQDRLPLLELAASRQSEIWEKYSWAARIHPLLVRIGALSE